MKIAIVGTAEFSRSLAPYDDESWTIYGQGAWQRPVRRWNRWFEIHRLDELNGYENNLAFLTDSAKPIMVQEADPAIPNGVVYPLDDILGKFGRQGLTSTTTLMMAYALHQGVDELALYGQDSNGPVWSICNINMILHNITRFTTENGDTLEDPQILENGQIRKFDRVLANPPFSQNYTRANMTFPNRFREWCPETGKKADLMFVQHMLASLKRNGHMATIMPHGVLFRGGKENGYSD